MGQMSSSCICILSYKISKSKRVMDKLRNCFSYKAQGITFNLGWHIYSMDLSNIKVDFLSRRQWFRFRGSFLKAKIPTDIIYRTSQTYSTSIKTLKSFSQPCFRRIKWLPHPKELVKVLSHQSLSSLPLIQLNYAYM